MLARPRRRVACTNAPRRGCTGKERVIRLGNVPSRSISRNLLGTSTGDRKMCNTPAPELTEQKLVRAYTRLLLVPQERDGSRRISLARLGNYEIFIIEFAQNVPAIAPRLWIELYAHDLRRGLDSCACEDLEQATIAARDLIAQARDLKAKDTSRH
jgi:hypothetical protein